MSDENDPIQHQIPEGAELQRLDRYLTSLFPKQSRGQIQKWIADGRVQVEGRIGKPSLKVASGQTLSVSVPEPAPIRMEPESIPLSILSEDEWLIVLDKPAGLVVHPAPGHRNGTLVNALLGHSAALSGLAGLTKPGIVHRLDKETSGLMVVAKDDQTHRALSQQFKDRTVERIYWTVVKGEVAQDEGTIDAPLARNPFHRKKMTVRYGGSKEALTRYRVLERLPEATVLELAPQTGRTHQLRVHLSHLGHPILGDLRYGVRGGFDRQALHARRLGFNHPGLGHPVHFEAPIPPDLLAALDQLKSS